MRIAIWAAILATVSVTVCNGQTLSARTELAKLEAFVGKWQGKIEASGGTTGIMTVHIEEAGPFISMIGRFSPNANSEGATVIAAITRVDPKSDSLRTWFHGPDGYLQGATVAEGNRISSKAEGFTNDGKIMSSVFTMEIDDKNLTMSKTESAIENVRLPDEEMTLSRVSKSRVQNSDSQPDPNLLAELQGTWRLGRGNGGWNEKIIDGTTEILRRYDPDGNIEEVHQAKFSVAAKNGTKHYTLLEMEFTNGPKKGTIVPKAFLQQLPGYDYNVTESAFTENQKRPDGTIRKFEWKRVNEDKK